jgi:hypothetical protein
MTTPPPINPLPLTVKPPPTPVPTLPAVHDRMSEYVTEENHKRFIREWVKTLRSGPFKQAQGKMLVTRPGGPGYEGHCCLGVGAEVLCSLGGIGPYEKDQECKRGAPQGHRVQAFMSKDRSGSLGTELVIPPGIWKKVYSRQLAEEADPRITSPTASRGGRMASFVSMNDGLRFNFNEIADVIEHNYTSVFKKKKGGKKKGVKKKVTLRSKTARLAARRLKKR